MDLPIVNYMGLTIVYVIFTVILINHGLLANLSLSDNIPLVYQGCMYSFIMYTIWGYYISVKSSENKCNIKHHSKSIVAGFTVASVAIIAYLLSYFIATLHSPFIELFGNIYGNTVAQIFFISLNTLVIIIQTYFNTAREICKVDPMTLLAKFDQLDKYLDTPTPV